MLRKFITFVMQKYSNMLKRLFFPVLAFAILFVFQPVESTAQSTLKPYPNSKFDTIDGIMVHYRVSGMKMLLKRLGRSCLYMASPDLHFVSDIFTTPLKHLDTK